MVRPVLRDSSVLFPNVLRDTLLTLAEHDLYEPQWSSEILAEVRRNVIAKRSIPESAIDQTLALMSATFEYATVEGWEPLVDGLHLPDPDDRHFPVANLRPYRIAPVSPDQFLQDLFSTDAGTLLAALGRQVGRYRRPPMDLDGLLTRLGRAGAPEFAKRVADASG